MKYSRFRLLAVAAMLGASSAPTFAAQTVRAGIEAWQRSDHAAAVAIWRPLAEKGNADAAFNLGQAYRLGRGVRVDLASAQKWLEKAAGAGHLEAQTTLGLLLFDSGSRETALRWLKSAAEQGEPRAMLVYGTALFNGDGVKRDPLMAYAYVSRAAAQGLEPAKRSLAEMDRLIPVSVRRRGVEIALQEAAEKPAPQARPQPKQQAAAKPQAQGAGKREPATSSPAASAAAGGWRIQLGAFSKRASAEQLYRDLSASAPLTGRQPFYVAAGAVTRLQVGPFPSRSAATAACTALAAKGQACFAVQAK